MKFRLILSLKNTPSVCVCACDFGSSLLFQCMRSSIVYFMVLFIFLQQPSERASERTTERKREKYRQQRQHQPNEEKQMRDDEHNEWPNAPCEMRVNTPCLFAYSNEASKSIVWGECENETEFVVCVENRFSKDYEISVRFKLKNVLLKIETRLISSSYTQIFKHIIRVCAVHGIKVASGNMGLNVCVCVFVSDWFFLRSSLLSLLLSRMLLLLFLISFLAHK